MKTKLHCTSLILVMAIATILFDTKTALAVSINTPGNLKVGVGAGNNIAKGKKYIFEQLPNYDACSEQGDLVQLTDGKFTEGYFWTQKSTIGWIGTKPITITIDLESSMPISGLSYSTAAGVAGVNWPKAVLIFTGENSEDYGYSGNLTELDESDELQPFGAYAKHSFWTNSLNVKARYVRLIIIPNGNCTFIDEVEIFKINQNSADSLLNTSTTVKAFKSEQIRNIDTIISNAVLRTAIMRRISNDVAEVKKSLTHLANRGSYEEQLNSIKNEVRNITINEMEEFSTRFPLNDLHRSVFEIQAAIWREKDLEPIEIWDKNHWDYVKPTEPPNGTRPSIEVQMMQNEYRSDGFYITNTGKEPVELSFTIIGLPGGVDPNYIQVFAGVFSDTAQGVPVMAALPSVNHGTNGYSLELEPGLSRQIWFTFNSKKLAYGQFNGEVIIQPNGLKVPISLKVFPLKFPDKPSIHLCGWDYTNATPILNLTLENRDALIKILKEHYIDTPWATNSVLPPGKYDANGKMIETPDTKNCKLWIDLWPNAENYFVFLNAKEIFSGFTAGTSSFTNAVGNWIDFWANQLKLWNVRPEQLGLLLVDEPSTVQQSELIIKYAKAIKSRQPKISIFEDFLVTEPWTLPTDLFRYSDIQCVETSKWVAAGSKLRDFYYKQQNAGSELWLYSTTGSSKYLDPYGFYRLQHWLAWQSEARGSCFWSFSDSDGASSWNEYLRKSHGPYTPLFITDKSVMSSKQMEAIRAGVQDYEYLNMLKNKIANLERAGKNDRALAEAKNLLNSAAGRVLENYDSNQRVQWTIAKERQTADKVATEILETLVGLEKK